MARGWPKGKPRKSLPPLSGIVEEMSNLPTGEVLGTIPESVARDPAGEASTWISPSGEQVSLKEPPPWSRQVLGKNRDETDARNFVQVPDWYVLRWMNRRLIDQHGTRGWLPLLRSDPNVKILVPQMVDASGNICRGYMGDLLYFMPRMWYEERQREKEEIVRRHSQSSYDKQGQLSEAAAHGQFGRYIKPISRKFPVQTQFVANSGDHSG